MLNSLFIQSIAVDWNQIAPGSYLRDIPAVAGLSRLEFERPVTFFVGENATGKSTVLEAIAVASGFNAEGGTRNYRFSTWDDVSELGQALRLSRGPRQARTGYFFRAESFFNVASKAAEYDRERGMPSFGDRGLHEQSHGEGFLSFFQTFRGPGLYLMDEPEAAISPQRQLTLLLHMKRLAQAGAQIIAVTHAPILLGLPGAQILSFDGGEIHPVAWEETESYRITKLFLEEPERVLRLLEEEDEAEGAEET